MTAISEVSTLATTIADDDLFLITVDSTVTSAKVKGSTVRKLAKKEVSQEVSFSGAIDLTKDIIILSVGGSVINLTLADGVENQELLIVSKAANSNAIITPTNFINSTITFTLAGQSIKLKFLGTKWYIISNYGTTLN